MSYLNGRNIKISLFNLRVLLVRKVVLEPFPKTDLKIISQAEDTLSNYAQSLSFVADYIEELEAELEEVRKDAAFYRCCALSGEVPEEGSQPSALTPPNK